MKELEKIRLGFYDFCVTRAEYAINADICEKIPDAELPESVTFVGLGNGKRSDAVQASLFDCIHAELLGERDAEKAKVRNRRKADHKAKRKSGAYIKRNGGDWRKDEHYAGDGRMWHDTYNWDLSKSQIGGKVRERSLRKDFITELHQHEDAIAEMYDYLAFAEDHAERAEMLRNKLLDLPVDHGNHSRNFAESIVAEIRYEEIRIKDMDTMAKMILKGECY